MEEQETKCLPLLDAYAFAERRGLATETAEIRRLRIDPKFPYTSSVRRGCIIKLFAERGVLNAFFDECWKRGHSHEGQSECKKRLRILERCEAFVHGEKDGAPSVEIDEDESSSDDSTHVFALEAHLRDFLAKNPERLESGLRLYSTPENEGVEFPIDNGDGRIDLLCVDAQGNFVVVELKLSRGRNKTLGQLAYYMGWVDKNLGKAPCRGIIVANDITGDLVTAVARVPGVTLYRYRMSFAVEKVG